MEDEGLRMAEVGKVAQLALKTIPPGKTLKGSVSISSELKCLHNNSVVQHVVDQSGLSK